MGVQVHRCTACGRAWHPRPRTCPACRHPVRPETLDGLGTVVSWTRVERPPEGFDAPQRVVLVRLDTAGGEDVTVFAAARTEAVLQTDRRVRVEEAEEGRLVARAA